MIGGAVDIDIVIIIIIIFVLTVVVVFANVHRRVRRVKKIQTTHTPN